MPSRRAAAPSPNDPEQGAARAAILEAARVEFAAKGLAGARVNEIAARAGVNKQLIYYYYGSKEDLYRTALEVVYSEIRSLERDLHLGDMAPAEAMAALIGFESPYAAQRSVVALTASSDDRVRDVLDVLEDPGKVAQIRGDLTVIRQRDLEGLRLGETYFVGNLPWYAWLWIRLSAHPALLAIGGMLAGLLVALTLFWALGRLAARRNGG